MNEQERVAFVIAQAAILNAQVAGMRAENLARTMKGEAPAYVEKDFLALADESICSHNACIDFFRK